MNEKFDKQYFDDIWGNLGGVHRHDYTESLATRLIAQYGKVRFLDLGTGCGELVRVLREKGATAYGLEISEYAVANSHGNVVFGSVTDIPFKDDSFDVVHSTGLWEYLTEDEIDQAVLECYRVGKIQDHNIDHDKTNWEPEYKYVTWKSLEWWQEKLKAPKVLVTCPTHQVKEYCFQEWIDNVKSLTYPNYDILVVDNSADTHMMDKFSSQIPMLHIDAPQDPLRAGTRMCQSMSLVQKHFLAGNYTHWMNIEADNIPPKNIIEVLMKYGRGADWVAHCYPAVPNSPTLMQGIGCSLLSRKLMTDFDWSKADDSPDAALWDFAQPVRTSGKYKTVEIWGLLDVKHLKESYGTN